jgi:hypothetical protein
MGIQASKFGQVTLNSQSGNSNVPIFETFNFLYVLVEKYFYLNQRTFPDPLS